MKEAIRALKDGARIAFLVREMRPYVLKPLVAAALAYPFAVVAIVLLSGWLFDRFVPPVEAVPWLGGAFRAIVAVLIVVFGSGLIFIQIATLVSGLAWERLAVQVLEREGLKVVAPEIRPAARVRDTVLRAMVGGFVGLLAAGLGWAFFGLVGVVLAGWLALVEFTAPALATRGVLLPQQWRAARKLRGAAPFALLAGLISLVPLLNLVALPAMVVAGTLLFLRSESVGA